MDYSVKCNNYPIVSVDTRVVILYIRVCVEVFIGSHVVD